MKDLFERGSAWLEDQRTRHAAHQVSYVRGVVSVDLSATVGRTLFEVMGEDGVAVRYESRDFLIRATDLVLAGRQTMPCRGDQIRERHGKQISIYEVMAPDKGPEWRWSDPYRKTLRIHTKYVATEELP